MSDIGNIFAGIGPPKGRPPPGDRSFNAQLQEILARSRQGGADPDDPPILVGRRTSRRSSRGRQGYTLRQSKKASEVQKDFYRMAPEQRRVLQERLFKAGFYGKMDRDDIRFGDADEASLEAYTTAISRAAAFLEAGQNKSLDDVIDEAVGRGSAGSAGPKRQPLVKELANPDDIRSVVERASRETLGRRLSDQERETFVTLYHSIQSGAQQQAYDLAGGSGGTVVDAPSLDTWSEQEIRRRRPAEAGAKDVNETFNEFMGMLAGIGQGPRRRSR